MHWFVCSLILCCAVAAPVRGSDSWADVLTRMPIPNPPAELNRTNCVRVMLGAFASNGVVKAMVFMPGATDEFYFFRRATASLAQPAPNLLDAVQALTNQTLIRVTFNPPFLLLHTGEDVTEPRITVNDPGRKDKIRNRRFQARTYFDDRDWDYVQPFLRDRLKVDLRPWRYSLDSWHFYRHSFAAFDLDCWEALQATSLAGGTCVVVNRSQVIFRGPPRGLPGGENQ